MYKMGSNTIKEVINKYYDEWTKKKEKNATRFNSKLYDHKLFLDPPKYV